MVSPIVATSLLLGLLGVQTIVALSMIPQWETPQIEEREYHYQEGTPFPDPEFDSPDGSERHCKPLLKHRTTIWICGSEDR